MYLISSSLKSSILNFVLIVLLLIGTVSCNSGDTKKDAELVTLTDDLRRELKVKKDVKRVMALSSAMTEMLFAVCPDSQIVAVTQTCNYPAEVKSKPIVNTYPLDLESILKHNPDIIFTEEGMTSLDNSERLGELGIPVYYQKYRTVDDIFKGLEILGKITGNEENANFLADSLRKEKQLILSQTAELKRPKVLAITWVSPIYVHGQNTIMTDKLKIAGGQNALTETFDKQYPELSREYILKLNPDIIIGSNFEKMDTTFFRMYPELRKVNAYVNKRIYDLDDDLTTRPGPRVLESVRELQQIIHPNSSSVSTN